jgi:DNA repair protein RecN (Recombination protein N)
VLEAVFEDGDKELLVRREVTAQGRSRSFVDGEMVTNSALKSLSARMVELHGQHEHQALLDPETHLRIIDEFGHLTELGQDVATAW